jgi:DNA-binding IclR family transcriptional regulator
VPAPEDRPGQTIAGLERALDVLSLFAESRGQTLGVTEIAHSLDLSKAVVHRVLASFRAKDFVEMDEETHRYSLGPKLLFLGLNYLNWVDVRSVARVAMAELSEGTDETSTLSVRSGDTRVYIDQVTPPRDVKMVVQLGVPFPLHAGASGKALLAFLPEDEQDAYLKRKLERLTPDTVTDPKALRKELATIRDRGFAQSFGERMAGAGAVAAPLLRHDGIPAAVISVCGPAERFRKEARANARLLVEVSRRTSGRLGYRKSA